MERKINDHLTYMEFESDILMFDFLDKYLSEGYGIIDHIYLCPVIEKDNEKIILSYLHIDNPDETIREQILSLYHPYETWKPDFSDTILNYIGGFRKNYGYESIYSEDQNVFDKKYKKCIVMILDGMGMNILEKNLPEDSFLRTHLYKSEHAIYPSTTAASTTATASGLTPLESGWTGWENWIREMNRDIILFNGLNYFTEEPTGRSGYDLMPWKPYYFDMDKVKGFLCNPDFSVHEFTFPAVLKDSLAKLQEAECVTQYVYYTQPDGLMHALGPYHENVKKCLELMDKCVADYAERLPKDTLLVITADHGHTAVKRINLYACKPLYKYLKRNPSNDARCITFTVKDGMDMKFVTMFNQLFGDVYKLMKSEDAIKEGYFGNPDGKIHERIHDFLGDYVAMAVNEYYFNYSGADEFDFKSHHAGITRDEMEVPVILVRK